MFVEKIIYTCIYVKAESMFYSPELLLEKALHYWKKEFDKLQ